MQINISENIFMELPEGFHEGTEEDKIKYFGSNIDSKMFLDTNRHSMISITQKENKLNLSLREHVKGVNHALKRNIPGYNRLGEYRRQLKNSTWIYLLSYTYYIGEKNMYCISAFVKENKTIIEINLACQSFMEPQMHDVFLNILESINR